MEIFEISEYLEKIYIYLVISDRNIKNNGNYVLNFGFAIDSVGPGGNFMTSPHTLEHMRDEYFNGNGITDRKSRQKWEKEGSLNTRERAKRFWLPTSQR
jgi:hypothetical protein